MSERPSLGWSAISKLETSRSGWEKLSRLVFLAIGIVVMAVVFLWLTDSAQKSTAHATGPDGVHYDLDAP
jgi:divalent metal cation (Fe/Co/Zn/Cd) transporter